MFFVYAEGTHPKGGTDAGPDRGRDNATRWVRDGRILGMREHEEACNTGTCFVPRVGGPHWWCDIACQLSEGWQASWSASAFSETEGFVQSCPEGSALLHIRDVWSSPAQSAN